MAYNFPEEENKILKFWEENNIFQKLREKNKKGKPWSFLDGPITIPWACTMPGEGPIRI